MFSRGIALFISKRVRFSLWSSAYIIFHTAIEIQQLLHFNNRFLVINILIFSLFSEVVDLCAHRTASYRMLSEGV